MRDYQSLQQKYVLNTYPDRQITLVKGDLIYLYDQKGKRYLDMMGNYGVSIFGSNNPKINTPLHEQLLKLLVLHGSFNNDVRAHASQKLIKRCGKVYSKVYWANSGTEAIEAALKFAVLATGKKKFIVCKNSYHGKTLGALSATWGDKYKKPFEPLLWKFISIEFDNEDDLEKAIDRDVAAFIVEPIQGESGIIVPKNGYLKKVQEICQKYGILLILDEIQTGMGRTGTFLASKIEDVYVDIVCLGKGLAGGLPVGATLMTKRVADTIPRHIHTSTFGGSPLVLRGVIATLDLLDGKRLRHVKTIGDYFLKKLSLLGSEVIVEVRGRGLMIGVEVKDRRNKLLKLLQDRNILAIPAGENVVRFLPPYIIKKSDVNIVVEAFRKCVDLL